MTTYIVSRHVGAVEWIQAALDEPGAVVRSHLNGQSFGRGDTVVGVLPLRWAGLICASGARVLSLDADLLPQQRGRELSPAELDLACARLIEYHVARVDRRSSPAPG